MEENNEKREEKLSIMDRVKKAAFDLNAMLLEKFPQLKQKFEQKFEQIKDKLKSRLENSKLFKKAVDFYQGHRKWFTKRRLVIYGIITFVFLAFHFRPSCSQSVPIQDVTVAAVLQETVPVYFNYVGTTASVRSVDIRARVEGFLISRTFKEGDDVHEGDLMFEIDPREYEAALENSRAKLAKDEAAFAFALEDVERYKVLVEKEYVTREFYDQKVTAAKEAAASVEADKANVETARLNLGYCKMYCSVNGRVGRTMVHVGNLVGAGQDTLLANVVQLDPIYIYFSPSENDYRQIVKKENKSDLSVDLKFDDGTTYPHKGVVDFVDNVVDQSTSTVKMRAVVSNPDYVLLPGIYVNVNLLVTEAPNTFLVPQEAVAEDQGGSYVLIVKEDNSVEERSVEVGAAYKEMKIVKKGVKVGERVIIKGMQFVQSGMKVNPEEKK